MNNVFANRSKEEEIYPLTVKKIAKTQKLDRLFKMTAQKGKYEKTSLQHHSVSWCHHYLQHSGNTCLKETLKAAHHMLIRQKL